MKGTAPDAAALLPAERERLVRLCARLGGKGAPAEDLAQETLLEAWRSWDRLRDPDRYAQWLSAIAHNVCLRWRRRQGTGQETFTSSDHLTIEGVDLQIAADIDLEIELERSEVADFLDRAMGLLPTDTRDLLVQRYVEDLPIAEIAARTGRSEGATGVRLHRGKRALRAVLTTHLRAEAAALGLVEGETGHDWQSTRIWCPHCGMARISMRRNTATGSMYARCHACGTNTVDRAAPYLRDTRGFWRTLLRANAEADRYFRGALATGMAPCVCCGQISPLRHSIPPRLTGLNRDARGVYVECSSCVAVSLQPDVGLVLTLPDVQRFWRRHKRMHTVGPQEISAGGRDALLVRFEQVGGTETLEVVSAADTFDVLHIATR